MALVSGPLSQILSSIFRLTGDVSEIPVLARYVNDGSVKVRWRFLKT